MNIPLWASRCTFSGHFWTLAEASQADAEAKLVHGGFYLEARDKMAGDILGKMDGLAKVGAVDATDWIRTAAGQGTTYPLGASALDLLNSLL